MKNSKTFTYSILLLLTPVFFIGCITLGVISNETGVPENRLNRIPKGSKIIFVEKNTTPDSLYDEVYSILLSRGHRIFKDDKERYYITTEGKDVGQSTLQRMVMSITNEGNIQRLKITTEWMVGSGGQIAASAISGVTVVPQWNVSEWAIYRSGMAFAESFAIADKIKDGRIFFE